MKKDRHQRKAYAMRRMSLAVDRHIRAKTPIDKDRAAHWAKAWATIAGIHAT